MRGLGFISGILTGYLLFTEEGKKLTKDVLGSVNNATEKAITNGKELLKESFPETSKAIEEEK